MSVTVKRNANVLSLHHTGFFFFIPSSVHKPHFKIHGFGQAVKYNSVCGQDMCRELREWGSNTLECKEIIAHLELKTTVLHTELDIFLLKSS